ncbi:MAG: sigma-70 family RNA polymerase sigma factor [Alphaproteobacteria bacterium]|nr:sigma-70 family RNA polymerase sigma factor [Alphaproteobacteria bacterium]
MQAAAAPQGEADREIVDAVLAGDPTAYRVLVERYQGRIYTMICGMVRDREEARDLTQEAFIKAFHNLSRFRRDARFYTWLYRIAMNVSIDHIRKHKKRQTSEFDEQIATRDADGGIDEAHRSMGDPGKELARKRLNQRIMDALDTLSPDHKQIILLREIEGFSYKEISDALEVPEGTVMSRLFYARKQLRKLLSDELPER